MAEAIAMEGVPKALLRAAYQRKPIYLLKVPMHFALWGLTTWVFYATQHSPYAIPIGLVGSFFIANLIRGLGAVGHDAVHGNCFKSKTASYWFGLLCWAPTGMAYSIYTNYHLHHHRIANTYPDVDNFVVTDYTRNPVLAKVLLLAVYSFAYPLYFLFQMFRYAKRISPWHRVRANLEIVGFWGFVVGCAYVMPTQVFVFFFVLPFVIGSMYASLTSLIEHYGMLPGEDAYGSRTYGTKAHLTNFIWNNVSYHNEHHKFPGIPFYNLRSFHEAAFPYYDAKVQAEVYPGVFGIAWKLYKRILFDFDIAELDARYAGLDLKREREKMMGLDGISPDAAEPA